MSYDNAGTFYFTDAGMRWEIGPAKIALRLPTIAEIRGFTVALETAASEESALHEVAAFVGRLHATEMGQHLTAGTVGGVLAALRCGVARGVLIVTRQHCEVGIEMLRGLMELNQDVTDGLLRLHEIAEVSLYALDALNRQPWAR